jgi:hypothetical protein
MNRFSTLIPEAAWKHPLSLEIIGKGASLLLGLGKVNLYGKVPNGQKFMVNPQKFWIISESHAQLGNENFGPVEPLEKQAKLGDFYIPQKGILATGRAFFETFNPSLHSAQTDCRKSKNQISG